MTKRELRKRIEALEKRVAELEDWADHAHRQIAELEKKVADLKAWPWDTNTVIRPMPYVPWDTSTWFRRTP